jgi:hypothetical protein
VSASETHRIVVASESENPEHIWPANLVTRPASGRLRSSGYGKAYLALDNGRKRWDALKDIAAAARAAAKRERHQSNDIAPQPSDVTWMQHPAPCRSRLR